MPRIYEPQDRKFYLEKAIKKGYTPSEIQTLNDLMINEPDKANHYLYYPKHRIRINGERGINNDVAKAELLRIQGSNAIIDEQNRIRREREAFEKAQIRAQRQQEAVEAQAQEQILAQREQERRAQHEAEQQQRAERNRFQAEREAQERERAQQAGVMARQAVQNQVPQEEYRAQAAPIEAAAQQQQGRNPMLTREQKEFIFKVAHSSGLNPEQIQNVSELIRSGLNSDDILQNIGQMQEQERGRRGREPQIFIDPSEFGRLANKSLREYEQAERAANQAAAAFGNRPQAQAFQQPYEAVPAHRLPEDKEEREAYYQRQAQEAYQARIREQAEQEYRQRVHQQFSEQERARQAAQQAYEASAAQLNRDQPVRYPIAHQYNFRPQIQEFGEDPYEPSPENLAVAAEAMAQARQAANVKGPIIPPPSQDPSVQSSRRDIDPQRAQASADILQRAHDLSRRPPHEMQTPSERIAFPTLQEQEPLRMARAYGIQDPHYYRAEERAQMAHEPMPQGIHRYMNPHQQHVVDRIAEEGNRNLFENILPALEARYIKLGQHGGKMHHDLGHRAVRDIQKEISAQQSQALASGYENAAQNFNLDKARQLEASRMHAIIGQQSQASRLSDMAALREAEQESRGFRQSAKDFTHHEQNRIRKHPEEMLNFYNQMAQGQPYSTTTQTYTPSTPQSWHRKDYQNRIIPFLTQMGSQFLG